MRSQKMKLASLTYVAISLLTLPAMNGGKTKKECEKVLLLNGHRKKITEMRGRPIGTRYRLECVAPYVLTPSTKTIKCVKNKEKRKLEWNRPIPRCICPEISCSLPSISNNVKAVITTSQCHNVITYTCKQNTKLIEGSLQRNCSANGTWSGLPPVCKELCPFPNLLQNGQITKLNTIAGTGKVQFSCYDNYDLYGDAVHYCSDKGIWTGKFPQCIAVCQLPQINSCRIKATLSLSELSSNNSGKLKENATIRLSCKPGYAARPERVYELTCNQGKWSGQMPICRQKVDHCEKPSLPIHSHIKEGNTKFPVGANITHYCHDGYTLQGHSKRQCLPNGEWCGFSPICKLITCPPLRPTENSGLTELSHTTAKFSCLDGYEMIGASILKCMPNGRWNGNPPRCIQDCGGCKLLTGGRRTLVVRSCSRGIGGQGAGLSTDTRKTQTFRQCAVTCLKTKSGYGSAEPRLLIDLLREYDVTNVKVYGVEKIDEWSAKTYKVSKFPDVRDIRGFEIHVAKYWNIYGNDRVQRQFATQCGHRSDTSKNQSVYDVCCGKPVRGQYLAIHIPGNHRVLSICEVEIFYKSKHCSTERKTSETAPKVSHCPDPGNIENGRRLESSRKTNFTVGSIVTYECNSCFELHGDINITCGEDGTWHYNKFPHCLKKACLSALFIEGKQKLCSLEDFPNGSIQPAKDVFSLHESVNLTCNKGYTITPKEVRKLTCIGECLWSDVWPQCEIKGCEIPLPLLNGQFTPTEEFYLVGTKVTYTCDDGFVIKGEPTTTCLETQEWSNEPSTCQRSE